MKYFNRNLNVDELIMEYLFYKTEKGYEPKFSATEIVNFIHFAEKRIQLEDVLYDKTQLMQRFINRKNSSVWTQQDFSKGTLQYIPSVVEVYDNDLQDKVYYATYNLGFCERSVLSSSFIGPQYSNHIKQTMQLYLNNFPKRSIDSNAKIDEKQMLVGKHVACQIINDIWNSYVKKQIEKSNWPKQCTDINKYLFEVDLASIIELKSIKKDLLSAYEVIAKRIAVLYSEDSNLKISSYPNNYLAYSNYCLVKSGFETVFDIAFGPYAKSLDIDLSKLTYSESHEISGFYDFDDEAEVRTTTTMLDSDNIQKLVRRLDNEIVSK